MKRAIATAGSSAQTPEVVQQCRVVNDQDEQTERHRRDDEHQQPGRCAGIGVTRLRREAHSGTAIAATLIRMSSGVYGLCRDHSIRQKVAVYVTAPARPAAVPPVGEGENQRQTVK